MGLGGLAGPGPGMSSLQDGTETCSHQKRRRGRDLQREGLSRFDLWLKFQLPLRGPPTPSAQLGFALCIFGGALSPSGCEIYPSLEISCSRTLPGHISWAQQSLDAFPSLQTSAWDMA